MTLLYHVGGMIDHRCIPPTIHGLASPSWANPRPTPRRRPSRSARKRRSAYPALPPVLRLTTDFDSDEPTEQRDAVIASVIVFEEWQANLDGRVTNWESDEEFAPFQREGDALTARIASAMARYGLATDQGHIRVDLVHAGRLVRLFGGRTIEIDVIHHNATATA